MGRLTDYFGFLNADPKELQLVKFNMNHLSVTEELKSVRLKHLAKKRKNQKSDKNEI